MKVHWLTTFKTVADTGSYTRASTMLFVSQPAVSKQVRQLERHFRTSLIKQVGHKLELTDAGKRVYELAGKIESIVAETRLSVSGRSRVVVAGSPAALIHALPGVLDLFWREYPDVDVKTVSKSEIDIPLAVVGGEVDIGISTGPVLGSEDLFDRSLSVVDLGSDSTVTACAPGHPLSWQEHVSLDELITYRVAIPQAGIRLRQRIDEVLAARKLTLRSVFETSTEEEVRVAALGGLAIGVLAQSVAQEDLAAGRLVRLPLDDFCFKSTASVIHRNEISPTAAALVNFLESEAEAVTGMKVAQYELSN